VDLVSIMTIVRNDSMVIFFSAVREYVTCVYTATALGCSISASDVYFRLLNSSLEQTFKTHGLECVIRHPMDVISIYTSTERASEVTTKTTSINTSSDSHKQYVSSARPDNPCVLILAFSLLFLYLNLKLPKVFQSFFSLYELWLFVSSCIVNAIMWLFVTFVLAIHILM